MSEEEDTFARKAPDDAHSKIGRPMVFGALVAFAILVAILSLPLSLESFAVAVQSYLGPAPLIIALVLGLIHGLKPDEHTWPITIPYALGQTSIRRGLLAAIIFTSALTVVWTLLSGAAAFFSNQIIGGKLSPPIDVIVGLIMVGVAAFILWRKPNKRGDVRRPALKVIWIHGLAAAFGGDFVAILVYTVAFAGLLVPTSFGWAIGLLFGLGSMASQSLVAYAAIAGSTKFAHSRFFARGILQEGSTYSLGFLGVFLIMLGTLGFLSVV